MTTLAVLAGAGCQVRSVEVVQQTTGTPTDAARDQWQLHPTGGNGGAPAADGAAGNGGSAGDGCASNKELCNGLDDDCDGVVDNVAAADLAGDPENCGKCGVICNIPRAAAACESGLCRIGACNPGYVDLDRKLDNGCECLQSNGGAELCDGADNDCDGRIDEDFDLQSDVTNCGKCGVMCSFAHADALCLQGACGFTCHAGHIDLDGQAGNGCEYPCAADNGGVEICDGKDNDCDGTIDQDATDVGQACGDNGCQHGVVTCIAGRPVCVGGGAASPEVCDGRDNDCNGQIDEADPNLGQACYLPGVAGCSLPGGECHGECKLGAWACAAGVPTCAGAVIPELEKCDGKDNDCDGAIDEDFDLQSDPRACGSCAVRCAYANAVALCGAGTCHMGPCQLGWVDADGDESNGCEYACTRDGPEVCDGKDNDCNRLTDEADPGLLYPVVNFCLQGGECGKGPGGSTRYPGALSFPVCTLAGELGQPDWVCNYPATVETTAPNQLAAQESWCDGLDNDCDGAVDEHTGDVLGTECDDGTALGECRRIGTMKCQADRTLAPACDLTGASPASPSDESCDGKDNDCDGIADESWDNPAGLGLPQCAGGECRGVRDALVHVSAAGAPGGGYYIFAYEASRPDASALSPGSAGGRACSRGGSAVLPWSSVSHTAAAAACRAAGMRLCRVTRDSSGAMVADEWGFACQLGKACGAGCYPYGASYDPAACNGAEKNLGGAAATGSLPSCVSAGDLDPATSGEQVFDLSGNLAEWTDDLRYTLGDGRRVYTTRGGAFDSFVIGLRCDFVSTQLAENFSHPDTGFRCCSSCAPGLADCAGVCKDLARDAANCGACGTTCSPPATCHNGVCR